MKHRKFVKQLMALGYQRNDANGLAMYARLGGWTYEQYLQIEKKSIARQRAMENITLAFIDKLTPAVKAAQLSMEKLREAFAAVDWKRPYHSALPWVTEQVEEDPLPPWPKENPHRCDALDALAYNMQIMSQADHAALHGRACGIDLAAGPDMTAYMGGGQE